MARKKATTKFVGSVILFLDVMSRKGNVYQKDGVKLDPRLPLLAKLIEQATKDEVAEFKLSPEKVQVLHDTIVEISKNSRDFYKQRGASRDATRIRGLLVYQEKAGNMARFRIEAK